MIFITCILFSALMALFVMISLMGIVRYLSKRNEKIDVIRFGTQFYKSVRKYKEMTKAETGTIGPFYYLFIVSIILQGSVVIDPVNNCLNID